MNLLLSLVTVNQNRTFNYVVLVVLFLISVYTDSMDGMSEKDKELLWRTVEIAHEAMEKGNHPFGALLADKDGNILLEQGNEFQTGGSAYHAETLLLLKAGKIYSPELLATCTLYSNFEPCCMCTGALYWSNTHRLVFGATEKDLLKYTSDNDENPTFSLSSRDVVARGQKKIEILGPVEDEKLLKAICADHIDFWKK